MRGIIYVSCFIFLSRATLAQSDVCAPEELRASIVGVIQQLDSTRYDEFHSLFITSEEARQMIDGYQDISEATKERYYAETTEAAIDSMVIDQFRVMIKTGRLAEINWQAMQYNDFLYRLRIRKGYKVLKGDLLFTQNGTTNEFRVEAILVNNRYRVVEFEFTPREVYKAPDLTGIPIDEPVPQVAEPAPVEVEMSIVEFPDKEAEFPGGAEALSQFIQENLVYPETALEQGIEGKVYLSFIISETGAIHDIKVERGVSLELDREAKRIVRLMPKWIPGELRGERVASRYRLPIVFVIEPPEEQEK